MSDGLPIDHLICFLIWGACVRADEKMTQESSSQMTRVKLPILKMGMLNLGACVLIGIGGGAISTTRGGVMSDGWLTILAAGPAIVMTLMGLSVLASREAGMWSMPVLAGTMFRAGATMALGYGVFMLSSPDKHVFVFSLLMTTLAALAFDVLVVLSMVNAQGSAHEASSQEVQG